MAKKRVATIPELIKAMGGPTKAAAAFRTTPQNVVNWRLADRIPPRFFLAHQAVLRARRIDAPADLWGMAEHAA